MQSGSVSAATPEAIKRDAPEKNARVEFSMLDVDPTVSIATGRIKLKKKRENLEFSGFSFSNRTFKTLL